MRCLPVKAGEGRRKGAEALGEIRGTFVGAPRLMLVVAIFKVAIWCFHFSVFVMWTGVCVCERERNRGEEEGGRGRNNSVSFPKIQGGQGLGPRAGA